MSLPHAFFCALLIVGNVSIITEDGECWLRSIKGKHVETGFHVAQTVLELIMKPRVTLDSWPSCLDLSSAEVTSNC